MLYSGLPSCVGKKTLRWRQFKMRHIGKNQFCLAGEVSPGGVVDLIGNREATHASTLCRVRIEVADDGGAAHFKARNPLMDSELLDLLDRTNTLVVITKRSREIPMLPAGFGITFAKVDPMDGEVLREHLFIGCEHLCVDVQAFDH